MVEKTNLDKRISPQYINLRDKVLDYTNYDMGLTLENDKQVYLAVFDIPVQTSIVGFQTQSLALVFGLNTHIYLGNGSYMVGLEKHPNVMKAMQSLLISSHQAISEMKLTKTHEYCDSESVRAYLKTEKGIYFKELSSESTVDKFLIGLVNLVLGEINKVEKTK